METVLDYVYAELIDVQSQVSPLDLWGAALRFFKFLRDNNRSNLYQQPPNGPAITSSGGNVTIDWTSLSLNMTIDSTPSLYYTVITDTTGPTVLFSGHFDLVGINTALMPYY